MVVFARGGVLGLFDALTRRQARRPMTRARRARNAAACARASARSSVASNIDFRLERGARHALIGPNGAGKTSFVNLVTGALRPSAGRILLGGEDITGLPQARARQARARAHLPDQRAVPPADACSRTSRSAIAEREGVAGDFMRPAGAPPRRDRGGVCAARTARARRRGAAAGQRARLRPPAA